MDIQESDWSPRAVHFVIEDAQMSFYFDAYLVDLGDRPDHPKVQCVALFPSCASLPDYLHAPGAAAEALGHTRLLKDAVDAYMRLHGHDVETLQAL